jgi:hypothetical protein
MKRRYFKILLAASFFQAQIVVAEVNIGASTQQAISNYPSCTMPATIVDPDTGQSTTNPAYSGCVRFYDRAKGMAGGSVGVANMALTMKSEPVNPCVQTATNSGSGHDEDYSYQACLQNFNNSTEMRAWRIKKDVELQESRAVQTEEDKKKAKLEDKSATGSMSEIQSKNEDGQMLYKVAGMALAGYAAMKFAQAASCGGPSMGSCIPPLVAAGAAFLLLSAKSNQQASEHGNAANEACNTYNQLSSAQKDCSTVGGGGIGSTSPQTTDIYTDDGKCKATAPPGCKDLVGTGSGTNVTKLPTNCKDNTGKAISCLAAGMSAYKQNPNGSITVKTNKGDKTYTSADFADKKAMMAAGMSAADADKLMDDLYGKNSALAKAGLDAKALSDAAGKDKSFGDFTSGGGTTSVVNVDASKDAHKKFGEKLSDSALADRRPSSEGLTRDFNGDLIGAAGDDIFSMMKRRYNLKNEQDTFIAP